VTTARLASAVIAGAAAAAVAASACGSAGVAPAGSLSPAPRSVQLNATGAAVDIEAHVVPGHITVVDFWAEWCGGCVVATGMLAVQTAGEPRIVVRKVDVGDGDTPVAEHYDIGPLPHLRVYDTHGKLRYVLLNNNALETGEKALEVLREDTGATPRPE